MKMKFPLTSRYSFHVFLCAIIYVLMSIASVRTADNFALLSGTLRTFQAHACDGEELHLKCVLDTVININFVQYGRQKHSSHLCLTDKSSSTGDPEEADCLSDHALKVIEKTCQGARICRILASPHAFEDDPCPRVTKYAEVAYKCRPENFVNKVACEGQRLRLHCGLGYKIVIYSATFGTTALGVIECPRSSGGEDCLASYATETVMSICSGQQKCSIGATTETFGNPGCSADKMKHLKVTYACVNETVLKPLLEPNGWEDRDTIHTTSYPAWAAEFDRGFATPLPTVPSHTFKLEMQSDEVPIDNRSLSGNQKVVGFISKWVSAHRYMTGNRDKLILYVSLSLGVGFLIFVTMLSVRLIVSRSKFRKNKRIEVTLNEDEFFSDSDLEHYEPSVGNGVAATSGHAASMKRQRSSDSQPRAPVTTTGDEVNHYFS